MAVSAAATLALLSWRIDAHNGRRDPESVTWGRLAKVSEECGEVIAAFIAYTGQNPRKPKREDAWVEVVEELLDVAVTALAAVEHMTGNEGRSLDLLEGKINKVAARLAATTRED